MNQVDVMLEPVRVFLIQMGEFMPKIFLVIVILIIGWLIAKAIKMAAIKGLNKINFHVLSQRSGMDGFLQQGGTRTDMSHILGWLIYWLVIVAALILASNSVGLAYVTELLGRAALLISRIILAVIILVLGCYFAYFIKTSIVGYGKEVRLPDAELMGRLARLAIIAFITLIALDQLNIGGDLIRQSFLIILAGVVLALGLAFGLGGRDWAAGLLAEWWPHRHLRKELHNETQEKNRHK
jgi:hypothetical protein